MSYHQSGVGQLAPMTSTQFFAESVDPYAQRLSPPGAIYAPYGWGPGFNIGMPFNYSHHIGYERVPSGTYDVLSGTWSGGGPGWGAPDSYSHSGILAVL